MNKRLAITPACLLVLAGCAHSSRGPGFGEVRSTVATRTGLDVQWNRGTPADAEVIERIRALLAAPLSADSAVQVALLNNRRMQAAYEQLGVAQADVVEAGLLENPIFHVRPRWPDRPPSGTNMELGVEWDFLQALMIPARKKLAGVQFERVRFGVMHEVLAFVAEVQEAYYKLVGAQQLTEVMRVIAQAAEASFGLAQRLSEAGNLPDLDLENHRALFEQAKLEYARAQLRSLDASERLNALMGLWGDQTTWTVPAGLPEIPAAEPALDHLESVAISNRLDLAEAGREVEALASALGITQDWRLFLFARIGVDSERDTDGQWVTGPDLQVELPVFNQRQASIARLEAELAASQDRLTALAVEIRAEVRSLRTRLLLSRQIAERYEGTVVPTHQRIVALAQQQYNFMLIGVSQVLDAKKEEMRTYRDYIDEVRDYWITRSRLERAVAQRFPVEVGPDDSRATVPTAAEKQSTLHPNQPDDEGQHHDHTP